MTPAEQLGQILADARRAGDPFDTAWPAAVTAAVSGQATPDHTAWLDALQATRAAWQAAWQRRPATPAQRALAAVAADDEREPLPDGWAGDCERCGGPIIVEPGRQRGPRRLYCSDVCRRLAHVVLRVAA